MKRIENFLAKNHAQIIKFKRLYKKAFSVVIGLIQFEFFSQSKIYIFIYNFKCRTTQFIVFI